MKIKIEKDMPRPGIEPGTSWSIDQRSTTEPRSRYTCPQLMGGFAFWPVLI